MSAFLGPIHYWLYRKISLQKELTDRLVVLAKEKYMLSLDKVLEEKYGVLEKRPLEEMIDEKNIHGWLQQRVSLVEYSLAEVVTRVLTKHPEAMEELKKVFYCEGEKVGSELLKEESLTLSQLFKGITDSLLDGMPCDHALQLVEQSEEQVVWTRTTCVHQLYWDAVGGNITNYYSLREAWLMGYADSTGTIYKKVNETTDALKRGGICTQ